MAEEISRRTKSWRRVHHWLTGFITCTVIALFLVSQWVLNPEMRTSTGKWPHLIGHHLLACYIWGLLTIGIVSVTARIGLDRSRWFRSVLTYLLIGVVFSVAQVVASSTILRLFGLLFDMRDSGAALSVTTALAAVQSNLIIFTVITSVCLALSYYRKYQDRELRATKLESQLTQAQLNALKSQLQPHFLFNTLNAIAALVREDPESAERMIVRLSDLLRTTLENVGKEEVLLSEELEFAQRYLEIEKMRFGDRLVAEERIDPTTLEALVPTLILQPLVENAMRHGVAAVSQPCRVTIIANRLDSTLVLEVLDSGPGEHGQSVTGGGVGIANTLDRLGHLYGDRFQFKAGNGESGGFSVRVQIPFTKVGQNPREGAQT